MALSIITTHILTHTHTHTHTHSHSHREREREREEGTRAMAAVQYGIYCQIQWVTMAINKSMQPDIGRMLLLDLPILKFDKAPAGCMPHTYIRIHVAAQRTALEW